MAAAFSASFAALAAAFSASLAAAFSAAFSALISSGDFLGVATLASFLGDLAAAFAAFAASFSASLAAFAASFSAAFAALAASFSASFAAFLASFSAAFSSGDFLGDFPFLGEAATTGTSTSATVGSSLGKSSAIRRAMKESRASSAVGSPSRSRAGFVTETLMMAFMMTCLRDDILDLRAAECCVER